MTYVKHSFSKCSQNNLFFKVFCHIMTHKMHASDYFFTGINWFSDKSVAFSVLHFFPVHSQKAYCFSMTFHDPHLNFRTFQACKMHYYKIP